MNQPLFQRLTEVAALFLKLGITAFGGPAAHIAMMHDETVKRRKWLSDQEFLDLVGATNLIPGPNSTEMAIHIGFLRAGWPGLIIGGICFIVPAMLIVLSLAWAYVRFGSTPQVGWLLYGVKPVVISIIVQALWNLGQKALKDTLSEIAAIFVVVLYFVGVNEIALLFAAGLVVMLAAKVSTAPDERCGRLSSPDQRHGHSVCLFCSVRPSLVVLYFSQDRFGPLWKRLRSPRFPPCRFRCALRLAHRPAVD